MWRDEEYSVRGVRMQETYDEHGQFVSFERALPADESGQLASVPVCPECGKGAEFFCRCPDPAVDEMVRMTKMIRAERRRRREYD